MTATQQESIRRHGQQLLFIFPDARERDPVALCRKLRRLEAKGAAIALRLCNGPEYPEGEADTACEAVLANVNKLLGNKAVPVILNRDPRGYALKIPSEWLDLQRSSHRTAYKAAIHRDWGGYGIIAPEIGSEG